MQTPFWAENHAEMYVNILNNELIFPEDNALDRDTRSFIRGVSYISLVSRKLGVYSEQVAFTIIVSFFAKTLQCV